MDVYLDEKDNVIWSRGATLLTQAGVPEGLRAAAICCYPILAALAGGNEPDSYRLNGVNILPVLIGEDLDYRPRHSYFYYSLTSLQAVRIDN